MGIKKEHNEGPVPAGFSHCRQCKEVHFDKTFVTTALGNSCVKMKGDFVLVCNILFDDRQDSVFIAVKNCVDDFYAYPCASSCLGVHQVSNLSRRMSSSNESL